jgi:hypothetical protein
VIPALPEIAREIGLGPALVALAAGVLTAFMLLAESIARSFDERDS